MAIIFYLLIECAAMRKLDRLVSEARKAAVAIRNFQGIVRVVSHYDADGIASASIIALSLSREGKQFRLSIIKQLSEERIRELASEGNLLTIFTDLGSGHLKSIQERLLFPRARAVILDHHQAKGEILPENSESVIHVNPMVFGINENLSGAGVAYFLAKELDPENIGLSYLGVVGAVGDSQMGSIEERWGLSGPNKEILKDAKKSQELTVSHGLRIWGKYSRPLHKALEFCTDPCIPGVSGSESASVQFLTDLGIPLKNDGGWRTLSDLSPDEQRTLASGIIKERIRGEQKGPHEIFGDVYEIPDNPPEFRSAEEFATVLNACGKLGKPYVGLSMCMRNRQAFEEAENLLAGYRKDIGKAISWVSQNADAIKKTERCTYMLAGDRVSEHIISNVASIFNKSGFVPEDKPVFAFADAEDGMVKVSARAHDLLVENGLNMESLVSAAASHFGGEGGGHKGAAGATIPKESQELFISYIEQMLNRKSDGLEQLDKAVFPSDKNNLNISVPEQEVKLEGRWQEPPSIEVPRVDIYGTAKAEIGREGESRGKASGDAFSPGVSTSSKGGEGPEKMEGQGLVRYFGPKDVQ
jgi:RecJ-like exonuclease